MAERIPDHAELEFARQVRTGRVHVLPYRPERWEDDGEPIMLASFLPEMPADPAAAEAVVDAILGRVKVLCGYEGYTAPGGSLQHVGREHFGDEAFCARCIRALGDQSPRAFSRSLLSEEDSSDG